ncbi:MAG: hypothetical protein QOD80_1452 [Verrucomicrobiota bacterium]
MTFVTGVRSSTMRLAVVAGLGIGLLSWVTPAALSQPASTSTEGSSASIKAAPPPAPALQMTGTLDFTRSVQQQRAIRELVDTMNVRDESRRALELQTLHEAPLTTFLNLSRFLTHKPYKRKDGSPLFDLTF